MRGAPLLLVAAVACGAATAPAAPTPSPRVQQLNAPGELVDVEAALAPGAVTVIDFWATWCGACEIAAARLWDEVGADDAIAISKVDIGDGESAVARHYQIGALPHLRLYDRAGVLRYVLIGDAAMTAGEVARRLAAER
ncbi:MAG: thioredoxin family protein [Kofleriaceae bacterium]